MKRLLFALMLFCLSDRAFAHNAQLAGFKLVVGEKHSYIDISLSQYGIEQALAVAYPEVTFSRHNLKLFKETLVAHLKANIELSVNGKPLHIGAGVIRLGSHQSIVKFRVTDIPTDLKSLKAVISCFQQNEGQVNVFKIAYDDLTARKVLNKNNNFQANFRISDKAITEIKQESLP